MLPICRVNGGGQIGLGKRCGCWHGRRFSVPDSPQCGRTDSARPSPAEPVFFANTLSSAMVMRGQRFACWIPFALIWIAAMAGGPQDPDVTVASPEGKARLETSR